jgi:hypothetical protein
MKVAEHIIDLKRHQYPFKQALLTFESSFPSVLLINLDPMIHKFDVQGEVLHSLQ